MPTKKRNTQLFVKILPGALDKFPVTMTELRVMLEIMLKDVNFTTNGIREYDQEKRADQLGISYGHYRDMLSKLRKQGVVREIGTREYVNPEFLFRGSELQRQKVLALFRGENAAKLTKKAAAPQMTIQQKGGTWDEIAERDAPVRINPYPGNTKGLCGPEIDALDYIHKEKGVQPFGLVQTNSIVLALVDKGYIKNLGNGGYQLVIVEKGERSWDFSKIESARDEDAA